MAEIALIFGWPEEEAIATLLGVLETGPCLLNQGPSLQGVYCFLSALIHAPAGVFGALPHHFSRFLASTLGDPCRLFCYLLCAPSRNFGCFVGGMSGIFGNIFRAASSVFADCFCTFAYVLRSLADVGGQVLRESD